MTRPDPLFDTHAHIIADDAAAYPPAAGARTSVTPFTVDQLLAGMDENDVPRACVVQRYHYYRNDNSYVLDACATNPDRLSAVVMLDGHDPGAPDELRRLAARQRIGGLRFAGPAIDSYDTAWLNSPGVMRLWEVAAELALPVTMIMFEAHFSYALPALRLIAETFPALPIVIDHMAVRHGRTPSNWKARAEPGYTPFIRPPDYGVTPALRAMIDCPNISYKFSGINLQCLTSDSVDPAVFLRAFADEFGVERIVCGSDIGQTKGPYGRIVGELRDALRLFTASDRQRIVFDNASRIYAAASATDHLERPRRSR